MAKKPFVLVILDGFGYQEEKENNAIYQAKTPHLDKWLKEYPHTLLSASGKAVGLIDGYIGNSEVGHMTIGAGNIIKQPVVQINELIDSGLFFSHLGLRDCLQNIKKNNGTLHIMGLLSDAGVHSHEKHLYAYIEAAIRAGIKHIVIHPFLDGRDVGPKTAKSYLKRLEAYAKTLPQVSIGSIHGRFYAMDRDTNWQRTKKSYDVLTQPVEPIDTSWLPVIDNYYDQNITDEFILPTLLSKQGVVKNGAGIIFINFRPDRARQLTQAFIDPLFAEFPKKKHLSLTCFLTPVLYKKDLKTGTLLDLRTIGNTLNELLSNAGKKIFTITETEKYAHVTYFFNGGRERKFENETRVLVPSIPLKDYTKHPCMSAKEITEAVLDSLERQPADFYLINYANADMVGHSGDFNATIKAVECLDKELSQLYNQVITKMDGTLVITADHGNAEQMFDLKTGEPITAHTNNPVPFLFIQKNLKGKQYNLSLKGLSDIAPFILKQMKVPLLTED